jgi:DNA-binding MarR family transcriptional regulator
LNIQVICKIGHMAERGVRPHKSRAAEPARWLTADEERAWRALAGVTTKLSWALESQLQRDAGLSFMEYHALAMLSEQPEYVIRMSELAQLTNASLSRLSHLVKRLEARGLIRREPDPTDGRFTNAILTAEGQAKLVASAPGHVRTVRALVMDEFDTDEVDELGAFATRILARLQGSEAGSSRGRADRT